jgi:hypothetical protein
MHRFPKSIALVAAALTVACSSVAQTAGGKPPSPVARASQAPQPVAADAAPETKGPEMKDNGGEIPAALLQSMRSDLSKQAGVSDSDIRLVSAEYIIWPNGALGCARPGEMYTQATVPGYRVQFDVAGRSYTYHAATRGFFKVCPGNTPLPRSSVQ